MKNWKKVIGIILAGSMLLAGCGGSAGTASSGSSAAGSSETAASSGVTDEGAKVAAEATSDEVKDWEQAFIDAGYVLNGDEEQTWGYLAQDFKDTFDMKIRDGFNAYVEANFPNVKITTIDGMADVNTQVNAAENMIANGVDAIVMKAVDSNGCVSICDLCKENNVPLIVVNADVSCEEQDHFFVGSDDYYPGQLQAEYLIENVDDSETVKLCYLGGTEGYTFTTLRRAGLYETLDKAGYNYEVLSDLEGKFLRDKGLQITEDWITRYGEDIDVICAANDEMAMGALGAINAAALKDVKICGIDANTDMVEEISKGKAAMSVFQDAAGQGKWAAIVAYTKVTNPDLKPEVLDIPFAPVTAENAADYL